MRASPMPVVGGGVLAVVEGAVVLVVLGVVVAVVAGGWVVGATVEAVVEVGAGSSPDWTATQIAIARATMTPSDKARRPFTATPQTSRSYHTRAEGPRAGGRGFAGVRRSFRVPAGARCRPPPHRSRLRATSRTVSLSGSGGT